MLTTKSIAVVVPADNEEALADTVVAGIPDFGDRVYVVDDGSTDATAERAREADARVERLSTASGTAESPRPAQPRRLGGLWRCRRVARTGVQPARAALLALAWRVHDLDVGMHRCEVLRVPRRPVRCRAVNVLTAVSADRPELCLHCLLLVAPALLADLLAAEGPLLGHNGRCAPLPSRAIRAGRTISSRWKLQHVGAH
ncbi:MAG: hypothetical protein OXG37_13470 [Actinomycetia bacterium]|nr:hypothetical protein [Actinomycetes bacterium]